MTVTLPELEAAILCFVDDGEVPPSAPLSLMVQQLIHQRDEARRVLERSRMDLAHVEAILEDERRTRLDSIVEAARLCREPGR